MTRLRGAVLAALVWAGVVAAGSTLVWVVISRAGEGVVPLTQPQADVTGSLPVPGEDRSASRVSPGVTLTPRPRRTANAAPTGVPTTLPPASSPPAPTPERRSWSGNAGHVVAECSGSNVRLVAAFPNAGWRYAIVSRGPALVSVRFVHEVGDDNSVTVAARCLAGVPRFTAAPRGGGGDDGAG
jgi:hypothetical protein